MKCTPLRRYAPSPPLSPRCAMREGGRRQRDGAALARRPWLVARLFQRLRVVEWMAFKEDPWR